jgi:hypothetical protein
MIIAICLSLLVGTTMPLPQENNKSTYYENRFIFSDGNLKLEKEAESIDSAISNIVMLAQSIESINSWLKQKYLGDTKAILYLKEDKTNMRKVLSYCTQVVNLQEKKESENLTLQDKIELNSNIQSYYTKAKLITQKEVKFLSQELASQIQISQVIEKHLEMIDTLKDTLIDEQKLRMITENYFMAIAFSNHEDLLNLNTNYASLYLNQFYQDYVISERSLKYQEKTIGAIFDLSDYISLTYKY